MIVASEILKRNYLLTFTWFHFSSIWNLFRKDLAAVQQMGFFTSSNKWGKITTSITSPLFATIGHHFQHRLRQKWLYCFVNGTLFAVPAMHTSTHHPHYVLHLFTPIGKLLGFQFFSNDQQHGPLLRALLPFKKFWELTQWASPHYVQEQIHKRPAYEPLWENWKLESTCSLNGVGWKCALAIQHLTTIWQTLLNIVFFIQLSIVEHIVYKQYVRDVVGAFVFLPEIVIAIK